MAEKAITLGYDGFDLAVRPGHPVNPGNISAELPRATRRWGEAGLSCPLITADVTCTDGHEPGAQELFTVAGECGVEAIKIGYFQFRPGDDFEATWDAARRGLASFERLAQRSGVRALYHTHSGLCLGSNCAGLRHLLEDFDPTCLGAYPDLGHLAVNGEDVRMGLAMLGARLGALAAKDARHIELDQPSAQSKFADGFVPLGEGAAEVDAAIDYLAKHRLDVPISVHTEYTQDQAVIQTVGGIDASDHAETLRERGEVADLAYLRTLEANKSAEILR